MLCVLAAYGSNMQQSLIAA